MGVIGGRVGYALLKRIGGRGNSPLTASAYADTSKLSALFGTGFFDVIRDQVVIDFGCGTGAESVAMAQEGARRVIGLDIQPEFLAVARQRAADAHVDSRCTFCSATTERADVIVSLDSFEHFADPASVLRAMHRMLKADGCVLASFGPTWYHPHGGHLFSVFPWAHLVFTERALIRWRSDFKTDGATRFHEVAGGLNQMTISRFEQLIAESPFACERLETVPIRRLRWAANRVTREFVTSIVRCRLTPRAMCAPC
jgi:SAM-dependent methyltransferase